MSPAPASRVVRARSLVAAAAVGLLAAIGAIQGSSTAGASTAPVNVQLPSITGSTIDGGTLIAVSGTWSSSTTPTYTYQWRRCDAAGANCVDIAGATSSSYTVASADVGSTIRLVSTATNGFGSTPATSAQSGAIAAQPVPVGLVVPYAGTGLPSGWLWAEGGTASRTTYDRLYAAVGTTYGAGDGSTTFGLPDLRGRFPLGLAASGTGSVLGQTGGSLDHTHTATLASHLHSFTWATHSHTVTGFAHTHTFSGDQREDSCACTGTNTKAWGTYTTGSATQATDTSTAAGAETPSTDTDTPTASLSSTNAPFIALRYIVKASPTASMPCGALAWHGRVGLPTGSLNLNGAAVSRTTYASLFGCVGTTFGAGDGSTTFNLPNLQQRFVLGKAAAGTGSTIAGTGGSIDHAHTATVAASSHSVTHAAHTHSSTLDAHSHTAPAVGSSSPDVIDTSVGATGWISGWSSTTSTSGAVTDTSTSDGGGTYTTSSDGAASPATDADNPPYLVLNAATYASGTAASSEVDPGTVAFTAATSTPSGWLLADGAAISRTTNANLFSAISTTFGTGDGSTTFNVPNLRQRFALTKASAGTGSGLGATGGTIDHTHSFTVAGHTHTITDPGHTHSFTFANHTHSITGTAIFGACRHGGQSSLYCTSAGTSGLLSWDFSGLTSFTQTTSSSGGGTRTSSTAGGATLTSTSAGGQTVTTGSTNPPYQALRPIVSTQARDTTAPAAVPYVNDGLGLDESSTLATTTLSLNWGGTTDQSGVLYEYCLSSVTACGGTPVRGWTSPAGAMSLSATGLTLTVNATYYACVRVTDSIGNVSAVTCSDGIYIDSTLTIGVDASTLNFGTALPGEDQFGTTNVTITSNDPQGYSLLGTDQSDAWGMQCACGGMLADWSGTNATPTAWAAGSSAGIGATVRDTTGSLDNRLAKWGTASASGWPERDVTNNLYAGLRQSTSTTLHSNAAAAGSDTVVLTLRTSPGSTSQPGTYTGTVMLTVVGNP